MRITLLGLRVYVCYPREYMYASPGVLRTRGSSSEFTGEVTRVKIQHKMSKGGPLPLNTPPSSPVIGKRLKFF